MPINWGYNHRSHNIKERIAKWMENVFGFTFDWNCLTTFGYGMSRNINYENKTKNI